MARRNRDPETRGERVQVRPPSGPSFLSPGPIGLATLAGVAILLFINAKNWGETRHFQEALDQMDARIVQLGSKVDTYAAKAVAPAPPRQGPDPSKVYTVKYEGAPAEGPASAPITIAEFSDFQ